MAADQTTLNKDNYDGRFTWRCFGDEEKEIAFDSEKPQKVERVAGWWEAISDLVESMPVDKLAPWQQKGLADNPPPADAGPLLIAGGNPTRTRNGYRVHKTKNERAWVTQLSPNTSGMRLIVDGVVRRLSTRALARIQGFPDDYPLEGLERGKAIHVLGNSVPPLLAARLIEAFARK